MKVERRFGPVVIRLETSQELRELYEALAKHYGCSTPDLQEYGCTSVHILCDRLRKEML